MKVPLAELTDRITRFRTQMDVTCPDWEIAAIVGKIPLYYFTGTIQDGILLILQGGEAIFWVRQSYERALDESLFPDIRKMRSYRDIATGMGPLPSTVYLETGIITLAQLSRIQKYLPFKEIRSLDDQIASVRSIKTPYEIDLLKKAGTIHREVLEDYVPGMLKEGINEASLTCDLFSLMMEKGHHGVIRFGMYSEMLLGQIGFGTNSIYPTCINTPGGIYGLHPSSPFMGNRDRKLCNGDLVYIDIGCGVEGYQTDKTMTYMFGSPLPEQAISDHVKCVEIQDEIATRLVPGAIPSEIYHDIINGLEPEFLENFMGYGKRRVNFLGHGIGLWIDELPVIAEGFDEPLQDGMVFAIEPKKGVPDVGLVGIENTFLVTANGGKSITGTSKGLLEVW